MTNYIYDSRGSAVGFWRGRYVYALTGNPIGQLKGTHIHKLSGSYVGELLKDMVVDKHLGNLGNIGNPGNPGNPGSPGNPGNRGAMNYGYPDVFHKLLEQVNSVRSLAVCWLAGETIQMIAESGKYGQPEKLNSYWDDFSNLEREFFAFIKEQGTLGIMPKAIELIKAGRSDLANVMRRHGGFPAVAEGLKLKFTHTANRRILSR